MGLNANFLQPDEVRYKEDLPSLGLDFIKLGLNDVLYNPKTKEVYTPNTNQTTSIDEKNSGNVLQNDDDSGIINEERYNHNHDPKNGRFISEKIHSITANDDGTITTVYKKSENIKNPHSGNKTVNGITYDPDGKRFDYPEIQLEPKEYLKVRGEINTLYESKYKNKLHCEYLTTGNVYLFENHGYDNFCIYDKF